MIEIAYQKRVTGTIMSISTFSNTGTLTPTGGWAIPFRSTDLIGITFAAGAVGTAVIFDIFMVVGGTGQLCGRSIRAA